MLRQFAANTTARCACSLLLALSRPVAPLLPLIVSLVSLLAPLSCPRRVPSLMFSLVDNFAAYSFPYELEYASKFAHMEMVVLTCGLLYGEGERIFDVFFRKAWETGDDSVPIIGTGENKLPTIHVQVRSQHLFRFPA